MGREAPDGWIVRIGREAPYLSRGTRCTERHLSSHDGREAPDVRFIREAPDEENGRTGRFGENRAGIRLELAGGARLILDAVRLSAVPALRPLQKFAPGGP